MKTSKCFIIILSLSVILFAGCSGKNSSEAKNLLREGMKCHNAGDLECAMKKYQAALDIEETAETWNLLGMVYRFKYLKTQNGEWRDKEIEAFKKAVELDEKYVVAIKNLGVTYYQIGEKTKAAGLFQRALELNPHDPEKEQLEKMISEGK